MMIKRALSQSGISSIAVMAIMILLSIMGLAISSVVTTSHQEGTTQIVYDQASFVNQAGLEYAMMKIYEGKSPYGNNISFGSGSFSVMNISTELMVIGKVGEAQVSHTVALPDDAACLEIKTSTAHTKYSGTEVANIHLKKKCGDSIIIDKLIFSWLPDNGEKYELVGLKSVEVYGIFRGPPNAKSGELVQLIASPMKKNQEYQVDKIRFVNKPNMDLKESFFLKLFLKDGSTKEVNFTLAKP